MDVRAGAGLASDTRSVDALRANAARDPRAAIKEAAKQFESLFMHELMKSMRQATLSSGMLDNAGSQMGTEMLDSQFSSQMAGLPGGLSEVIARHLARQLGGSDEGPAAPKAAPLSGVTPARDAAERAAARAAERATELAPELSSGQAGFVQRHLHDARGAQAQSGIPASFMVAQAAHETGWGRKEILHADGTPSFNLFGIKAGAGWTGPVAEVRTTEYVGGKPQSGVAKFRAYASYEESFADYARLMKDSPRYSPVLAQAGNAQGFAQGLQRAGYATDPAYADKLGRVINTTLRLQRSLA